MKNIKTYKLFNESLKDKLVGKSDDEITNGFIDFLENTKIGKLSTLIEILKKYEKDNGKLSYNDLYKYLDEANINIDNASIIINVDTKDFYKFVRYVGTYLYDGTDQINNEIINSNYRFIIYKFKDLLNKNVAIFDKDFLINKLKNKL